jgi:CRISPR/Cas system-associated protein Cas7 (RAMP superfamily)
MKTHTTNYTNTLIEIAEDSPVSASVIPVVKNDKKTIAHYQYEKLSKHPLKYTSDELLFEIFAERNDISPSELEQEKQKFFLQRSGLFAHVAFSQEKWIWDFS